MVFRKCICVLFAIGLMMSFAACAGSSNQSKTGTAANQNSSAATGTATASDAAGTNSNADAGAVAGARLEQLNLAVGASPVIRKVALDGNRAGISIDEDRPMINGRTLSTDNIRFIFELNEWISIRMDASEKSSISAVIVPHQDNLAAFSDQFDESIPDDAPRLELSVPENPDDPMASWGELYLHVEYWKPGNYDLVFLSGNKPVARVNLKFYPEDELANLSDTELEKLMKN